MANGVRVSRSAIEIVTQVRCDERSNALLQFARFPRGATESRPWQPAYSPPRRKGSVVVRNWTEGRRRISDPRDVNVVRSAASLAPVVAIACCILHRKDFRFGPQNCAKAGSVMRTSLTSVPCANVVRASMIVGNGSDLACAKLGQLVRSTSAVSNRRAWITGYTAAARMSIITAATPVRSGSPRTSHSILMP
jgi:hypothetical protein